MILARAFRGFRFPPDVILWAVRWYLRFPLTYRDLELMLADRGVAVDHVTLHRWTQRFAPELEKRVRRHLRPCRGPWHVDATSVRVGGAWRHLDRAVDPGPRSATRSVAARGYGGTRGQGNRGIARPTGARATGVDAAERRARAARRPEGRGTRGPSSLSTVCGRAPPPPASV